MKVETDAAALVVFWRWEETVLRWYRLFHMRSSHPTNQFQTMIKQIQYYYRDVTMLTAVGWSG